MSEGCIEETADLDDLGLLARYSDTQHAVMLLPAIARHEPHRAAGSVDFDRERGIRRLDDEQMGLERHRWPIADRDSSPATDCVMDRRRVDRPHLGTIARW